MEDLIAGSLVDAMEALAKLAADRRTRPSTYAEKQAAGMSDVLSSLGGRLQQNPTAGGALLGGGLGAGVGALSTAFGNRGKEDYERKSLLGGALGGGLAGAGLGAGAGLAYTGAKAMGQNQGVGTGDASPLTYTDPGTGKQMQIDPGALKANPQLNDHIRQLKQQAPPEKALASVGGNLWNFGRRAMTLPTLGLSHLLPKSEQGDVAGNLPVSSTVLPGMAMADYALNSQGARLGERIGWGAVRPRMSRNVDGLRRGLMGAVEGSKATYTDAQKELMKRLTGTGGNRLETLAGKPGRSFTGNVEVDGVEHGTKPVTKQLTTFDSHGNPSNHPITEDVPFEKKVKVPEKTTLTGDQLGNIREEGARTIAGEAGKNKFRGEAVSSEPRIHRTIGGIFGKGRDVNVPTHPLRGMRLGKRMLAYGAVPLGELAAGTMYDEHSRESQLKALMAQHAKPVPGQ